MDTIRVTDKAFLTGVYRTFGADELIVSKTDTVGRITYANETFIRLSGYTEDQLLGKPHSIIRHPLMPRAVFKLLWDTIASGTEIFAYVINRSCNGDQYWVFAHVTPNCDAQGTIVGYHSNRRVVRPTAISRIQPLYQRVLAEEKKHADRATALKASYQLLCDQVRDAGFDGYDRFVLSL